MTFKVTEPPRVADKESQALLRFFVGELQRLADSLTLTDYAGLNVLYASPKRPFNGMVVYADGAEWDPGSGEGFYGYENGAWVKL